MPPEGLLRSGIHTPIPHRPPWDSNHEAGWAPLGAGGWEGSRLPAALYSWGYAQLDCSSRDCKGEGVLFSFYSGHILSYMEFPGVTWASGGLQK